MLDNMFKHLYQNQKEIVDKFLRQQAKVELFLLAYGARTRLAMAVYNYDKDKELLRKYKIKLYSPVIKHKEFVKVAKQVAYYAKRVEQHEEEIRRIKYMYEGK
jgi:hypothetical protein